MEYKTLDDQVREEGRLEGYKEGRAEGIREGVNNSSIEAAKRMLNDNLSFDSILSYLPNLTIDTLNSIQNELLKKFKN